MLNFRLVTESFLSLLLIGLLILWYYDANLIRKKIIPLKPYKSCEYLKAKRMLAKVKRRCQIAIIVVFVDFLINCSIVIWLGEFSDLQFSNALLSFVNIMAFASQTHFCDIVKVSNEGLRRLNNRTGKVATDLKRNL